MIIISACITTKTIVFTFLIVLDIGWHQLRMIQQSLSLGTVTRFIDNIALSDVVSHGSNEKFAKSNGFWLGFSQGVNGTI